MEAGGGRGGEGVCGRGSGLERRDSCRAQQGESSEVPGTEEREGRDAKAAWPDPARSHAKRPGQPLGQRWGTWDRHMHKEVPDCCRQRPLGTPARWQTGSMQHWLSDLPHSSSGLFALWSKAWWGFWKSWSHGTVYTKQRRALRWMRASPLPSSRRERSPSQLMPSPCRVSE